MTVTEKLTTLAEMMNALAVTVTATVRTTPELTERERAQLEMFADELGLGHARALDGIRRRKAKAHVEE